MHVSIFLVCVKTMTRTINTNAPLFDLIAVQVRVVVAVGFVGQTTRGRDAHTFAPGQ